VDDSTAEAIRDVAYITQLSLVLDCRKNRPDALLLLSEEECDLLDRYYLGHGMPNPDQGGDEKICAYRRKLEAEQPGIGERAGAIVERLQEAGSGFSFSYLTLRRRVLDHMLDHPEAFRELRLRELRTLDRYFLIERKNGKTPTPQAALRHSQ